MPQAERRAEAVWEGNLIQGQGKIVNVGSGALSGLPVTWASRTERSDGKTSPEELIAAAHASCYAMQLSHTLAQASTPAQSLDVNAVCTFVVDASGARIASMNIDVRGKASGLDDSDSSSDYTVSLPWEVWRGAFMQDSDEETARLVYSLLSPEPMRVYEAKLDQKAFFKLSIPKSYLLTRQDIALPPGEFAWYPRFGDRLGAHKFVETDGSHEACFTRPVELANAIVEASTD